MNVKKYVRIFLNILIPLLIIYLICFWGPKVLKFFMPFAVGWVIAMIANPLVRFLEKRLKIVRKHSSVVLVVGVLALVVVAIYLLFGVLFRELSGFIQALPQLFEMSRQEVSNAYQSVSHLFTFLPQEMETSFEQVMNSVGSYIGDALQGLAASAGGAVARTLPEVFVNTIVLLLSSYLFLAEHDRILVVVRQYSPDFVIKYMGFLRRDLRTVIGGYFMAQFKIMFVVAVILLVGFLVLGIHYSFFLAIAIAFLDFLPMFGTGTALIPWALVKLFTGEYVYAFGLAIIYVVSQAVRQVIQPKIVGDSMGLPPLTTLFFLYMGFKVRGIAGMILAVPIGLIFINFYRYGAFDSLIENIRLLVREVHVLRSGKEEDSIEEEDKME